MLPAAAARDMLLVTAAQAGRASLCAVSCSLALVYDWVCYPDRPVLLSLATWCCSILLPSQSGLDFHPVGLNKQGQRSLAAQGHRAD
jgi:hypothetical protein